MESRAVLVPYPVERAYDYSVPDGLCVEEGDYVRVPFGQRMVWGVVWGEATHDVDPSRLKSILCKSDLPPLNAAHRRFLSWGARYTMSALGAFLKLSLVSDSVFEKGKERKGVRLVTQNLTKEGISLSEAARRVLSVAADKEVWQATDLQRVAECSAGVLRTLLMKGFLEQSVFEEKYPCAIEETKRIEISLSVAQSKAAEALAVDVQAQNFSVTLLDGVTGSGKTEVYFEAVAAALDSGKQALILLPEIALSTTFLSRFRDRFGVEPALWHSALSAGERRRTWRGVSRGESRVVVGARSALFLPYANLGLIVVDEEHEGAYKQEEGVIYNARDMAVARAHMGQFPAILVSATPSLETMSNVWQGRYGHLELPDRHGSAGLPDVHLVDLRTDRPEKQKFIAPSVEKAIRRTVEEEEGQVLLFLNRRGYAPLTLCRQCGHRFECPQCSAWLVEHRNPSRLLCHHCGYHAPLPPVCPSCGETDSLAACGPGVERIMEEVREKFPAMKVMILSSDTAQTHEVLSRMLAEIHERKVDIIIGTQMIAKGHHFPRLTCVAVIDADLGLSGGDLRASEKTYQLLHQVAGRAGRAAHKGHVYLQTYAPESRVIQALAEHDRRTFLEVEMQERERARMPPVTRLAGIIVSGRDEQGVERLARALAKTAPFGPSIQTLGPVEAPIYRLRGRFRRRLLVRADKTVDIQKTLTRWVSGVAVPSSLRVQVDIDPQSFF